MTRVGNTDQVGATSFVSCQLSGHININSNNLMPPLHDDPSMPKIPIHYKDSSLQRRCIAICDIV